MRVFISLCVLERKREKRIERLKEKKYCYEERRWQEEFKSRKGAGRETLIKVILIFWYRSVQHLYV